MGHVPVEWLYERVSIDAVEYKTALMSNAGVLCEYDLSEMDHLTRCALLIAAPIKEATSIAIFFIDGHFTTFGIPEELYSDQGAEFENKLVHVLQQKLGSNKNRTTPLRPPGNSVSERVRPTLHAMLAMYAPVGNRNQASLLPCVQMACNTSYRNTVHNTPHFLLVRR